MHFGPGPEHAPPMTHRNHGLICAMFIIQSHFLLQLSTFKSIVWATYSLHVKFQRLIFIKTNQSHRLVWLRPADASVCRTSLVAGCNQTSPTDQLNQTLSAHIFNFSRNALLLDAFNTCLILFLYLEPSVSCWDITLPGRIEFAIHD